MNKPTDMEIHKVVTWLRTNEPEKLAAHGLNYLRSSARLGDAVAAIKLRSLGAMKDPTGAGLKTRKGKGAAPLAEFLHRAVISVKKGKSTIEDTNVLSLINELPDSSLKAHDQWFSAAWSLYELTGGPDNDETVRELGNRSVSTSELPKTSIMRAVKECWDRRYKPRPSVKTQNGVVG